MKDISITGNHPVKKRIILGPLGRLVLKLINWDIVGDLPDNKKIIIGEETDLLTYLIQIILRIMAILTSIETDQ